MSNKKGDGARWRGRWGGQAAVAGLCLALLPAAYPGGQRQVLPGHVPAAARRVAAVGRLDADRRLNLAIGLPLRNPEALEELLAALSRPGSPRFRQYLTPQEFASGFGPAEQDYEAVAAFMTAKGLTVTARHPNRVLLEVSGRVADVERAFHVRLKEYPHPEEARNFYAPDTEPELELRTPVLHIGGLDNYRLPRPMIVRSHPRRSLGRPPARLGSGLDGSYLGYDFRAAYAPGVLLTGAGQRVGLVEFDGYHPGDIAAYAAHAGLPNVPIQRVQLNDFDGTPGEGNAEVALDIELAMAMAPGLDQILVYEGGPGASGESILCRMADDRLANQLGSSWTFPTDATTVEIFQQLIAQGQSLFNASGDADAYSEGAESPTDSPYLTSVGGTSLVTGGGSWLSETVWNYGSSLGSGGGVSSNYSLPPWQAGLSMAANAGSTRQRNIPDVAMVADHVFAVANNGETLSDVGGTSCAAQLWAAFTALVNEQAAADGQAPVGFLNPALYAIGQGPGSAGAFHDITTGNNTNSRSPTRFFAVPGYDLCTGWGTPNGSNLISAVLSYRPPAPTLPTLLAPQGNAGGFSFSFPTVVGQSYTVQYTAGLAGGSWSNLSYAVGDGTAQTVTESPGAAQRFYRVTSP